MADAPRLTWSTSVAPLLEDVEALTVLYSLLADPDVDYRSKFPLDVFPYSGKGVKVLQDDSWYATYSVDGDRNVTVHSMKRREDIDRIGRIIECGGF